MKKRDPVFLWVSIVGFGIALFLILVQNFAPDSNLPGFTLFGTEGQMQQMEYAMIKPEEVVRQYFESWNRKDWPNMYATLSDGFKRIDPKAKDLAAFRNSVSSQGIDNIRVIKINVESNDGTTAVVAYSVEFIFSSGDNQNFSDKFTLKSKQGDVIPGWKLIHPYGTNIDTS